MYILSPYICVNVLSWAMVALATLVSSIAFSYGARHMAGEKRLRQFNIYTVFLWASLVAMACADHLIFFGAAWCIMNLCTIQLMAYNTRWTAARASVKMARTYLLSGSVLLIGALALLHSATGKTSLQTILYHAPHEWVTIISLTLIGLCALIQCAAWPFHKWLISALNAPTPALALVHACVISSGGFLLIRFAPLYIKAPHLLMLLFTIAIITTSIATTWKLMQNDVKRKYAYASVAQMGFCLTLVSLGLVPAALLHLLSHGLLKNYLFLNTGSAYKKTLHRPPTPSLSMFLGALCCGFFSAYAFISVMDWPLWPENTVRLFNILVMITSTQVALTVIQTTPPWWRLMFACLISIGFGALYGFVLTITQYIFAPVVVNGPQHLSLWHMLGVTLLAVPWILMFFKQALDNQHLPQWVLRLYVRIWNAGQPHPQTITAYRNHYRY